MAWGPLLGSLLLLAVGTWLMRPTLLAVFSNATIEYVSITDPLDDQGENLRKIARVEGSPVWTESGIAILPGEAWQITLHAKKRPNETPFARLWIPTANGVKVQFTFADSGQSQTIHATPPLVNKVIRPSDWRTASDEFEFTVSASFPDDADAEEPVLVLDRLELGSRIFEEGTVQRDAWAAIVVLLFPWLILGTAYSLRCSRVCANLLAILASVAASAWVATQPDTYPWLGWGTIALTGALLVSGQLTSKFTDSAQKSLREFLAVCLIVGLSLAWRWQWLLLKFDAPLAADSATYFVMAQNMRWPYDTCPREPLIIWLIWLWCKLTAWGPLGPRMLTLLLSTLEAIALFAVCRRYMRLRWCVVVGVAYAFNPVLASSAVEGLREEALPLTLLIFLCGLLRTRENSVRDRLGLWAMRLGLIFSGLTRLTAYSASVPIYLWQALEKRWNWRSVVLTLFLLLLFTAPHFWANYQASGDPMASTNIHAAFYRNLEFAGQPGFISREEFERNAFAGGRITTFEYFFKLHSVSEFTSGTLVGAWSLLVGEDAREQLLRLDWRAQLDDFANPVLPTGPPRWFEWLLIVLYWLGFVACLRSQQGQLLVGLLFFLQAPLGFLVAKKLLVVRLMMNGIPFMLAIAGVGGDALETLVRKGWQLRLNGRLWANRAASTAASVNLSRSGPEAPQRSRTA